MHLHPSFGGADWDGLQTVDCDADTVYSRYFIENFPIPSFFSEMRPAGSLDRVDEWDDMRWDAPASMYLHTEFAPAGAGRASAWRVPSAHILTPASEHATHYFWTSGVQSDSCLSDEAHRRFLEAAFDAEDLPMIEAVQRSMGQSSLLELRPALLRADRAALRARKILARMIEEEASAR
jgi:vanillate O-demethylase monooxygenase subunit